MSKLDILHGYQRDAYNYLLSLYNENIKGGILALEMGMGKTMTSIEFARDLHKVLIVCEKTNIQTWINHFDKHYEDETYIVLHKDFISNPKEQNISGYKFIITTFDFVMSYFDNGVRCYIVQEARIGGREIREGVWTENDITLNNSNDDVAKVKKYKVVKNTTLESENKAVLFNRIWDMIIIDEVNKIVNHTSKISRALTALCADFYLILSGRPMINYSKDLFSLFRIMGCDVIPREFNVDYFNVNELRKHIYIKTYDDVNIKLPELKENIISVNLSNEELEVYNVMKQELRERVGKFKRNEDNFLSSHKVFTHMRMFLTYPYMLSDGESDIKYIEENGDFNILHDKNYYGSKMNAVINKLEEHEDKRILIFSQYVGCLKRLKKISKRFLDRRVKMIYGKTTSEDRIRYVDMMNEGDIDILLVQIKIGNSGLNIQGADVVYILEPSYNLATESQAIARAHRIGRIGDVEAYRFIVSNSFEYYMLKIQHEKEEEKVNFLGGINKLQKSITMDIMESILSNDLIY